MWRSEAGSFPTVRVDVKLEKTSKTKNRIESFRFRCLCWRGRVRIQQDETEQYGKFKSLTKDVVEQWIDSIYVYGESRIDINYKEIVSPYLTAPYGHILPIVISIPP